MNKYKYVKEASKEDRAKMALIAQNKQGLADFEKDIERYYVKRPETGQYILMREISVFSRKSYAVGVFVHCPRCNEIMLFEERGYAYCNECKRHFE